MFIELGWIYELSKIICCGWAQSILDRILCCNSLATTCNDAERYVWESVDADSAVSTITANFEARNDDVKAAIALDLSFEAVEKVALELCNFAASETRHVNVISLRTTFVKMFFAL